MNGFAGVFDGQQHTIYGMYSQHGMFISLCYGGTIKNLNKDASVMNGSENSDAVGGLVGAIETRTTSSESMYIEYCSFNGIVSGSSSAGGLVGDIDIYDPEAGKITEQYEVEGANLTNCRTVDDETICAIGDDSTYYLVSREDGSCTAYLYN